MATRTLGLLEDKDGDVLSEEEAELAATGWCVGEVFVAFETTHLSWPNLDYPYEGPWSMSRVPASDRTNRGLRLGLELAIEMARSNRGIAAFKKLDPPGHTNEDVRRELANRMGPSVTLDSLPDSYSAYRGDEAGAGDDAFTAARCIADGSVGATDDELKNFVLLTAIGALNSTAHWKWDTKHEGGEWTKPEPGGDAGITLEREMLGGTLGEATFCSGDALTIDGAVVPEDVRDDWLDPRYWRSAPTATPTPTPASLLELEIAVDKTLFEMDEEIPVTVTYRNIGADPIHVVSLEKLEGYPLWFEIVQDGQLERVPFRGARLRRSVDWSTEFTELAPAEEADHRYHLLYDQHGASRLYGVIAQGA